TGLTGNSQNTLRPEAYTKSEQSKQRRNLMGFVDDAKDKLEDVSEDVKQGAEDMGDKAKEWGEDVKDKAQEGVDKVVDKVDDWQKDQKISADELEEKTHGRDL